MQLVLFGWLVGLASGVLIVLGALWLVRRPTSTVTDKGKVSQSYLSTICGREDKDVHL